MYPKRLEKVLATLFVTSLVVGTMILVFTGRDVAIRFSVVGATGIAIVWLVWFTFITIKGDYVKQRYFEVATTTALHGGIVLLLLYFFWFFLSEFLEVQILGPAPPLKSSKLAISGATLIGIGSVVLFVAAFLTRKKKSTPRTK